MGVKSDVAAWKGPNSSYAWMQQMLAVPREIAAAIPDGATYIIVDEDQLGTSFDAERRGFPFPERNGAWSGIPAADSEAIDEVERLRDQGAQAVVFISSTFWCLYHFKAFPSHLRT